MWLFVSLAIKSLLLLANDTISIIEQNAQENGTVTLENYDGDDNPDGGEFSGSTAMAVHNAHLWAHTNQVDIVVLCKWWQFN